MEKDLNKYHRSFPSPPEDLNEDGTSKRKMYFYYSTISYPGLTTIDSLYSVLWCCSVQNLAPQVIEEECLKFLAITPLPDATTLDNFLRDQFNATLSMDQLSARDQLRRKLNEK